MCNCCNCNSSKSSGYWFTASSNDIPEWVPTNRKKETYHADDLSKGKM